MNSNLFSNNYEPNQFFDNLKINSYQSALTQLKFVEEICENDIDILLKSDYLIEEIDECKGYNEYDLLENIKNKIKKDKINVSYNYAKSQKVGRVYAMSGISVGGLRKQVRNTLTHSNYDDWDIKACHQSILIEICSNNKIDINSIKSYVENRDEVLTKTMNFYKCNKSQAKQLFCGLLYGQSLKNWIKDNKLKSKPLITPIIKDYKEDVLKIANIIKENNIELYNKFVEIKKKNPIYTTLSYFLQEKERIIIENCLRFVIKNKYIDMKQNKFNVIYCYDGLMLYKYNKKYQNLNSIEFKNQLEQFIKNELKVNIIFENKFIDEKYDLSHTQERRLCEIEIDYEKPFDIKKCEEAFKPLLKNQQNYYDKKKDYLENGNLRLAQVGTGYVMNFNDKTHFLKKNDLNTLDCVFSGFYHDLGPPISFLQKWCWDAGKAFYHTADFYPTRIDEETPSHIYNLFLGYNKFVSKTNKNINYKLLEPFFELVKAQCEDNEELMNFFLKYYSTSVQTPRDKIPIAFIFHGSQGTGASTMIMLLQSIFKDDNAIDSANIDDFFGGHSEGFMSKCHVNMNEMSLQKSYKYTENIKSIITDNKISVNPKCVRPFEINNFAKVTFTTNNIDGVPIDVKSGERRFNVYKRSPKLNKLWDFEKWSYVRKLKDNPEFVSSLFWYLMSLDFKGIHWEKAREHTESYKEMTEVNTPPMVSFIEHIIKSGILENNVEGTCMLDIENNEDPEQYDYTSSSNCNKELTIKSTVLYGMFKRYCKEFNFYTKEIPSIKKFGKIILDYNSCIQKKRKSTGISYCFIPIDVITYFEAKHFI